MYLFSILSSFIYILSISIVSSDTINLLNETPEIINSEQYDYIPRAISSLRFNREVSPSSFLRFGRKASFLRFGRSQPSFYRIDQELPSQNFLRFGKRGQFLRFG